MAAVLRRDPLDLADLGLPADKLRWTAEQALGTHRLIKNNPRPLDVDALEHIVRAAHAGDRAALRGTPATKRPPPDAATQVGAP